MPPGTLPGPVERTWWVGAGSGGWVRIYDPLSGTIITGTLGNFRAFGPDYTGGAVSVGADPLAGEANPGARSELVVGTGAGAPDEVKVFSGAGTVLNDVRPFGSDFSGGVRVSLAYISDPEHPSVPDVVISSGPGDRGVGACTAARPARRCPGLWAGTRRGEMKPVARSWPRPTTRSRV